MDIFEILLEAAKTKTCVQFIYEDQIRRCSPHVIGTSPGRGEMLLAYQYGGGTSRGQMPPVPPEWKCFQVSKIRQIQALPNDAWQFAPTKGNQQSCVKEVVYRVEN